MTLPKERGPVEREPIAIIGSACRFPGSASSPSKLWDLLRRPKDVLREVPPTRFNADKFYHDDALHQGTSNVRHSYFLSEDHRVFDAQFFGVKPVEAKAIDPQQRILLETAYEALESAGVPLEEVQGSNMGVFVGVMNDDYSNALLQDVHSLPTYFASGTARSILSNRLSYFFDTHGPSMTIDTACSSSLVAVHQAVSSLRSGEACSALVAGSNLILGPEFYIASSKLKMLSPSGRSRMWDQAADGYGRGDGFGVLVLKTLSQALADNDSIECIIRETGINQDGRTKGITMPSATAQASLIKATYAKAGLDLSNPADRPQYFEAHGTGTPAGDPIEAEAISTAFFGAAAGYERPYSSPPLYVGSVKTVIGHTEGAAGIAGLMKASLALQSAEIPPNLLLSRLNPAVKPFYQDLRIPQETLEWPETSQAGPRRASVNSFGFGGTNAHAILESFSPEPRPGGRWTGPHMTPFNLSAVSEKSLADSLAAYSSYVKTNPSVDLRDLAWTLSTRRSTLPVRASVSALNATDLAAKLEHASHTLDGVVRVTDGASLAATATKPRLLGIFTGQGAQWAAMGAQLLQHSPIATSRFESLQRSLDALPKAHAPRWSLREELAKDSATSRINQAAYAQPLSTAVQIALVDLLGAAKVEFAAVVGHSSGEIAAAYAAGYLSAGDAIRVSYYRGLFLTGPPKDTGDNSPDTQQGAMLAVGTSYEDATDLCELPGLAGRVCVAAVNSPTSVTLSGDASGIQDCVEIMEDEKKFARLLKVDMAYHSHHMARYASSYIAALRDCGIQVRSPLPRDNRPAWISSVTSESIEGLADLGSLGSTYWGDNMVKTVLFSQAVGYAVGSRGPFDMAIEVGPHPALKKPVSEAAEAISGQAIPYIGSLKRGHNDIEAFSDMLGSLWLSLGPRAVDYDAFDRVAYGSGLFPPAKLIKGLPAYSWVHDRSHWHESRHGRAFRTRGGPPHQILGSLCPEEASGEVRYKNHLSPRDIPWLSHHQIQGQIVFPAAGYVSAVVEAATRLCSADTVQLVELLDFTIGKSLVFSSDTGGAVTILSLRVLERSPHSCRATFSFYSDAGEESTLLVEHASGELQVVLGPPSDDALPRPYVPTSQLLALEPDEFYNWARELGYGYEGTFRGLCDTSRKMNESTGWVSVPDDDLGTSETPDLIMHPSTLDCAIQGVLLAHCYPGDGGLRSLHMPTKIERLSINLPAVREYALQSGVKLPFYATMTSPQTQRMPGQGFNLRGDVDVHSIDGTSTIIQLQGLHITPLIPPSVEGQKKLFFEMTLGAERPTGSEVLWEEHKFPDEHALAGWTERVAFFYLRRLGRAFPRAERGSMELQSHHARLLEYVDHCVAWITKDTHPYVRKECLADSEELILECIERHPSSIDLRVIRAVGEGLLPTIRGETNILEAMRSDNMIDEFYHRSLGMPVYLNDVARIAGQLSHRFPHMDILEIGAGSGATTASILGALEGEFSSYTFTDVSSGFFENAQDRFASHHSQMLFKVLDIERSPSDQGFREGSYDLVVGSLVLHATRNLEETMARSRKLLRPGGYLIMLEVTNNDSLRVGLVSGSLPGWWVGNEADGRILSPCISAQEWETLARKTGFSGIEAITPHNGKLPVPLSVMVFQALDDRIEFLREPLAPGALSLGLTTLTIVGGTSRVPQKLHDALSGHYHEIQYAPSLEDSRLISLPLEGTVLSVAGLEVDESSPFHKMTAEKLEALQRVFSQSKKILWVSLGATSENPHNNIFRGLQRSVALEMGHVQVRSLDFATQGDIDFDIIAQKLLQLEFCGSFQHGSDGAMDILWPDEPEIFVQNGQVLVPRLRPSQDRNQRYNSTRMLLTRRVAYKDAIFSISHQGPGRCVEEKRRDLGRYSGMETVQLTNSLVKSVRVTKSSTVFISLGNDVDENKPVIVLSNTLESEVYAPPSWVLAAPRSPEKAVEALLSLFTQILAQSIIAHCNSRGSAVLAVLNPGRPLGHALEALAAKGGIELVLLATATESYSGQSWVYIHPRATRRSVERLLPANVAIFVSMDGQSEASDLVESCLAPTCLKLDRSDLIGDHAKTDSSPLGIRKISDQFQAAWMSCLADSAIAKPDVHALPKMTLDDITQNPSSGDHGQALVIWDAKDYVSLPVQPASKQVSFAQDKTYWLVGLTGGLGLSLCRWMADRGAKYIALSSRNPSVDLGWIQSMASIGCIVKVFSSDVTDRQSVRDLYRHMQETMPPVAGVAQGSMVLKDNVFPDLDVERLETVLKPKVTGSIHLDELFSEDTLDFFVFFSSLAYIVGNRGQSAYTAANSFMASLAARRRGRGLAGSVIHIGAIIGEGYVSRQLSPEKQAALHDAGFLFMSEHDLHETFAEGVLASRGGSFEIAAGLRVDDEDNEKKTFASNPIFQHLISKVEPNHFAAGEGKGRSGLSIKALLLGATSEEEMFGIVRDGFIAKLQAALQTDLRDEQAKLSMSLDSLGVDSLVAVDIQSWFRKELSIDISTLKILNAPTIEHLLSTIRELLVAAAARAAPEPPSVSAAGSNPLIEPGAAPEMMSTGTYGAAETLLLPASLNYGSSSPSSEMGSEYPNSSTATSSNVESVQDTNKTIPILSSHGQRDLRLERVAPMSFAQARFWFLRFLVDNPVAFNVTTIIRLKGHLDVGRLARAVTAVGRRHEAIRTSFYTDEITKKHMQGVLSSACLELEHATVAREDDLEDAVQDMRDHVFDLSMGKSVRIKLLSLPERHDYCIVLAHHHIVMDGIGQQVFLSDLEKAYNGALDTSGVGMTQYPDFTLRQMRQFEEGSWATELEYWHGQFPDLPPPLPVLSLSCKPARPATLSFSTHLVKFRLGQALQTQVEQCCRLFKVTAFHFYLAVFRVFLFRHTNSTVEDMCIGVADGNRKDVDVLQSLGLFLNLIPMRFRNVPQQTFADALREVKTTSDDAFANSRVPIDVLFNELKVARDPSHSPLFQAFLNYRQNIRDARTFCGCEADGELIFGGENAYDISLDVLDSSSRESTITLGINSDIYTAAEAEVLKRSYLSLLQGFMRNMASQVAWPALYLDEDVETALDLGRGPERSSAWPATIVDRIDDMAEAYKDQVALSDGLQRTVTYGEMASHVSWLASQLPVHHLDGKQSCIGVFQTPGLDWIFSFLAVLRTGIPCVPLDPLVGHERLRLITKECQPKVILVDATTRSAAEFLQSTSAQIIDISQLSVRSSASRYGEIMPARAKPCDTAVITYTSGSTGVPKGIIIKHGSYRNFVEFAPRRWGLGEGKETILQQSSYAFDMSIGQIFVCLGHGGKLIVPDASQRRDPGAICELIAIESVTFTLATPTEYLSWIQHGGGDRLRNSPWRGAMSGGEPISASLVRAFASLGKPEFRLIDSYGPSETTFGCADSIIPLTQSPPSNTSYALSPIPNYAIYIVDGNMNPVPAGVLGQVAIGGAGVAAGYLNQQQLTATAFLPDKHASPFLGKHGWSTVHLSGDRGRLDARGRLTLHGRIQGSTQVKIRGIRMDLEDVENTIMETMSPHVRQAVVCYRPGKQGSDSGFLVAFVVLSRTGENGVESGAFLTQLPQKLPLPQYMRPSLVLSLDSIPKTASNKVDRAALNAMPLTSLHGIDGTDKAAKSGSIVEVRESLLSLWRETLPQDVARYHVAIEDSSDFFHIGGSSLALVQLKTLIRDRLHLNVSISRLFEASTLGQMTTLLIDHEQISNSRAIEPPVHAPVDWTEEVSVDPYLSELDLERTKHTLRTPAAAPKVVVLTGSTGFLGREILRQLVEDSTVSKIYCLAIRRPKAHLPELFAHAKVTVCPGDLGSEQLGLSDEDTRTIFNEEADMVVHVGADVSFLKTYQSLKRVNVASTKELARLSLPRRLPFHFVSTASVAGLSGLDAVGPVSVAKYPPTQYAEGGGYVATKWVSEVYLENISERFGLPVVVHRPSGVTGEEAPESDLMTNIIKYSRQAMAVPDLSGWSGSFDFISVHAAAKMIVEDMVAPRSRAGGIRYQYESGEVVIGVREIQSSMEITKGERMEAMPMKAWLDAVAQAGMDPLLVAYLRRMVGGQLSFPRLVKDGNVAA